MNVRNRCVDVVGAPRPDSIDERSLAERPERKREAIARKTHGFNQRD
jgi:hypothetical protein